MAPDRAMSRRALLPARQRHDVALIDDLGRVDFALHLALRREPFDLMPHIFGIEPELRIEPRNRGRDRIDALLRIFRQDRDDRLRRRTVAAMLLIVGESIVIILRAALERAQEALDRVM